MATTLKTGEIDARTAEVGLVRQEDSKLSDHYFTTEDGSTHLYAAKGQWIVARLQKGSAVPFSHRNYRSLQQAINNL